MGLYVYRFPKFDVTPLGQRLLWRHLPVICKGLTVSFQKSASYYFILRRHSVLRPVGVILVTQIWSQACVKDLVLSSRFELGPSCCHFAVYQVSLDEGHDN